MGVKQVFVSALNDVQIWAVNQILGKEQLGTIRFENNAVYKYVAFSGANVIAAGDVVCYVAYASDGSMFLTDIANTAFGAGIAQAAVAAGTKASGATYYATGWIQIKGWSGVLSTALGGSPTIGQPVTTQGASNKAVKVVAAATDNAIGWAYDSTAKIIACDFPF
jgi:hypothetical protein